MMPEAEAIVQQRSLRKVAFFCNVSSLEGQDLQSEKRLNQKKKNRSRYTSIQSRTFEDDTFIYQFLR